MLVKVITVHMGLLDRLQGLVEPRCKCSSAFRIMVPTMQVRGCLCLWGQCIIKKQSPFSLNIIIKENEADTESSALILSVSFFSFFLQSRPQYCIQSFLKSKINSFENLEVDVNWEHFKTSHHWIRVCPPINHYAGSWRWKEFEKSFYYLNC